MTGLADVDNFKICIQDCQASDHWECTEPSVSVYFFALGNLTKIKSTASAQYFKHFHCSYIYFQKFTQACKY